jgi:DNA-binding GntR family transcriptional regulator
LWSGRVGLHVYLRQLSPELLAKDADEHHAILAAIDAGQPEAAERLTHAHIEAALAQLLESAQDPG